MEGSIRIQKGKWKINRDVPFVRLLNQAPEKALTIIFVFMLILNKTEIILLFTDSFQKLGYF